VSLTKAPATVARLLVPEKMLRRVAALTLGMWYTVVRYTNMFDSVPIVPSFSNVSFPTPTNSFISFRQLATGYT
jgi:hypothetical protein